MENKKVGRKTGSTSPDCGLNYQEEGNKEIIFPSYASGNCLIDPKSAHHVTI